MRKKFLTMILAATFTFGITFAAAAHADDGVSVIIDGRYVVFDGQSPVIVDGRTLVPVRGVFEQLGFYVEWDAEARQATLTSDDYTVVITIGSETFTTNDANHTLDVPAQIIGGRTMLPIRAVLESVGYYLGWDGGTRTVRISPEPFEGDRPAYITIQGERFSTELTTLELPWVNLTDEDIIPLRYMTNLTWLILIGGEEGSQVRDLTPLSELTNLRHLNLSINQISDLTPLAGLVNLEILILNVNQISDLTPLSGLTNLRRLGLDNNQFYDLSPLAELTNLTWLNLGDNRISDLTPLEELPNLTQLLLHNTQIIDLTFLTAFTNLTWISLNGNRISDLTPLADLINLTNLDLENNQISNLEALAYLTSLETLWLRDNQISDLSPLANLTNLRMLGLERNRLNDLTPLSGLLNLTSLFLADNYINDLTPLTTLTNLTVLILGINDIKDISPLRNLTNLGGLSLNENPITDWSPVDHIENVYGRPQQLAPSNPPPDHAVIHLMSSRWRICGMSEHFSEKEEHL